MFRVTLSNLTTGQINSIKVKSHTDEAVFFQDLIDVAKISEFCFEYYEKSKQCISVEKIN